jgi:hypothetical protein
LSLEFERNGTPNIVLRASSRAKASSMNVKRVA